MSNWITPLKFSSSKNKNGEFYWICLHLLSIGLIKTSVYNFFLHIQTVQQTHDSFNLTKVVSQHFTGENTWSCSISLWNEGVKFFPAVLRVCHYSACSCSWPGISHRILSVRMVAYIIKLIKKNKENTSNQSTLFIKVLGRGPIWSAWVTTTFFLASIPEREISFVSNEIENTPTTDFS